MYEEGGLGVFQVYIFSRFLMMLQLMGGICCREWGTHKGEQETVKQGIR